jgi:hypothetical protein
MLKTPQKVYFNMSPGYRRGLDDTIDREIHRVLSNVKTTPPTPKSPTPVIEFPSTIQIQPVSPLHQPIMTHICPKCPAVLENCKVDQTCNLLNHLQEFHQITPNCPYGCNRLDTKKRNMVKHINRIHHRQFHYSCQTCAHSFSDKEDWRRHSKKCSK